VLRGYDLARARGTWFFGCAIGWFVMIPLVLTRRTVYKMRGVRIITAMFAALSVVESAELLLRPPHGSRFVALSFDWGWGVYATLALGVAGVALGARFGGRVDDIDAGELLPSKLAELSPEESDSARYIECSPNQARDAAVRPAFSPVLRRGRRAARPCSTDGALRLARPCRSSRSSCRWGLAPRTNCCRPGRRRER